MDESLSALILLAVAFAVGATLYLIPTIVATRRGHPNSTPIAVVNVLLGWTLLGYVVALAWSLTAIDRD